MGTNSKVYFLGGMGGRSLVVFQGRKVGCFLIFQGIIVLVVWDRVVGEKKSVFILFFLFFFCDLVI
jgi:hypothetical protein